MLKKKRIGGKEVEVWEPTDVERYGNRLYVHRKTTKDFADSIKIMKSEYLWMQVLSSAYQRIPGYYLNLLAGNTEKLFVCPQRRTLMRRITEFILYWKKDGKEPDN